MTTVGFAADLGASDFFTVWEAFVTRYPTEESCLDEIYRLIYGGNVECGNCRGSDFYKIDGRRVLVCRHCCRQTRPTAGTFFHGIKFARPWLALIWLLGHGISINSWQFHKLVGIAYSSALNILKKLTFVIESHMAQDFPCAPSLLFDMLICRRSKETPQRKHPREEGEAIDEPVVGDQLPELVLQASAATSFSAHSDWFDAGTMGDNQWQNSKKDVLAILSTKPIHFDVLLNCTGMEVGALSAALTMLEISGLVARLQGDWYVRSGSMIALSISKRSNCAPEDASYEMADPVGPILAFVRSTFHGISRKYLQLYVAAHWCLADRKQWGYGALLNSCLKFRRLHYSDILSYVSPPLIRISPAQS